MTALLCQENYGRPEVYIEELILWPPH